jgi:cysteine-rich repeat protein
MKRAGLRSLALSAVLMGSAVILPSGIVLADPDTEALRSWPKDTTEYARPLVPSEFSRRHAPGVAPAPAGVVPVFPSAFIVDTVVANADPNLTTTDTFNDGETSIAVNPEDRDEIVISSFSAGWSGPGTNAIFYHSTDGGVTWTQQGVPPPPGWDDTFCPCDWAWDWGTGGALSGTILASLVPDFDVTSVTTADATNPAAFAYNGNPAQRTNNNVPGSFGNADQPWLLANPNPSAPAQDNVYVAWDDFNNTDGISGVDMRVAVSGGVSPLDFTLDRQVGNSAGSVNPGLRLADNRGDGTMWVLWGRNVAAGAGGSKNMDYMLNRSTDGGATWTLNGDPGLPTTAGIVVANADSTQPRPKFGTVNALLGGAHHAGVNPVSGDLYYVYGNRDAGTGNNRLAIRRVTDAGGGNVAVGPESFVTGQVEAAIPQVAVLDTGTVGVFYYTFDGIDMSGFPQFSAHLATSVDQGATFTDATLVTFLSSATDNADDRQRVLGDYMQMKALGDCFYGSFTGNGAAFGRSVSNHDPIFFKTCNPCGNGAIDAGETCDDGNTLDGDCCSSTCQRQSCSIDVAKDAFLRKRPHNTNEGANTILSVRNRRNRTVVAFDLSGKNAAAVTNASLVLTVQRNLRGWGRNGKDVAAHALLEDFVEGNGQLFRASPVTRGTGAGVTYECAVDSEIANVLTDCAVNWDGGNFAPAASDTVLHTNATTGAVSFDVTPDVQAGSSEWLLKRASERGSGGVEYYSREGAALLADPNLTPKLLLDY